MRSVEAGFRVTGYELDPTRLESLRAGHSYVEDVPSERIAAALRARATQATDRIEDLADFDVAVISVPTPLRDGAPDLSYVESAAATLARVLRAGRAGRARVHDVPRHHRRAPAPAPRAVRAAGRRGLLPRLLARADRPRQPHVDLREHAEGRVRASTPQSLRCVEAFYGALVEKVVPVGSTAEAELVKLLENTFRHVNIALVNELAMFAGDLGVDIWRAIDAASTKPFGYMRFTPGPGVGGHCLPVDPSYLSWRVRKRSGHPFRFVELANDVNEHMPDYVARRITALLNKQLAARARHPHPAARHRVQGRHLGLARVTVDRGGRAARGPGCRRAARATRTSPRCCSRGWRWSSSTSRPRRWPRPTWCSCSWTIPSSIPMKSVATPSSCSTRRASCAAGTFAGETL